MGKVGRKQKSQHRAAQKAVKRAELSETQPPKRFLFGISEAHDDFSSRHPEILNEYPKIRAAQDRAISGATKRMKVMDDKVIYFLARQVFEDFDEVLLLCGNGLSTGALKILRGMFERTVTLCYLQKNPTDIELYHKYYYVRHRKETKGIARDFPKLLSKEQLDKVETEYEKVKSFFKFLSARFARLPSVDIAESTEQTTHGSERILFNWPEMPATSTLSFG